MKPKYLFEDTFNASAPIKVDSIRIEHLIDENPDVSWLEQDYSDCTPADQAKYRAQDAERLAAFNRGDWYCIGIRAKAVVSYPCGNGSRRLETFTSSGLWGIESDSDADYIKTVERDELSDLQDHLSKFGVPFPKL